MKKVGKSISVLIVPDFSVTVLVSPLKEKYLIQCDIFVGEGLVSRVTWFTLCASTWFTCYQ